MHRENFFNKYFFCGLLLLALPLLIQAEIFNYRESGGAVTVIHTLTFTAVAGGYIVALTSTQSGVVTRQGFQIDATLSTRIWTYSDPGRQIELSAVRDGDTIVLSGVNRGCQVKKTFSTGALPWNQLFQMGLGLFAISGSGAMKFWSIGTSGPGEMKIAKFTVSRKGEEKIQWQGKEIAVVHLRIALSGLLSIFWHGDYWYRKADGRFLRYRGKSTPGAAAAISELIEESPFLKSVELSGE